MPIKYIITFILLLFFTGVQAIGEDHYDKQFPVYPGIRANVDFWKRIYSEYTTTQVVFHDRRNLSLVYGAVTLKGKNESGAGRYNREVVENQKSHYSGILKRLSSGHEPASLEEKRILEIFTNNELKKLLKDAHDNIRTQLGQKDRFLEGLIRSGAFLDEIKKILKSYGVPEDLAYLPHVESSFDYQAYSKFGAAGIWQFTHDTGRKYMKIDYTVDERRDPVFATHAAAKFLKDNYDQLKSWPIAITAYNHGTQGMLKAVKSKGDYENIYNSYEGRTFGFASRNFYSEFLAAREIAQNYSDYFGEVKPDEPVKRIMIENPGYVSIDDLAGYFKVSADTIRSMNPAFREPLYSNMKYVPKGFRIFLPEKILSDTGLVSLEIPTRFLKSSQKPSLFYRVRPGDTADKIAREHKIKLKDLILANQLNSRSTIYAGQNLRIPGTGEKMILASSVTESTAIEGNSGIVSPVDSVPSASENVDQPPVKDISDIKILAAASTELKEKEEETVPQLESSLSSEGEPPANPAIVTGDISIEKIITEGGEPVGIIRVEPEETLGHYADWLKVETRSIRSLNGFTYERKINLGQRIRIPLEKTSRESFEEKRYEYHKEIEEDFFAAYYVEKTYEYIIKRGDNLWVLCLEKFDIPFWLLKKYNPKADFTHLSAAEKLIVPVVIKIGE